MREQRLLYQDRSAKAGVNEFAKRLSMAGRFGGDYHIFRTSVDESIGYRSVIAAVAAADGRDVTSKFL
jgi:hypothetical protein